MWQKCLKDWRGGEGGDGWDRRETHRTGIASPIKIGHQINRSHCVCGCMSQWFWVSAIWVSQHVTEQPCVLLLYYIMQQFLLLCGQEFANMHLQICAASTQLLYVYMRMHSCKYVHNCSFMFLCIQNIFVCLHRCECTCLSLLRCVFFSYTHMWECDVCASVCVN